MPRGFRKDHAYQVVAIFTPNGTQTFHYLVINESGDAVPLPTQACTLLDPLTQGHEGANLGGGGNFSGGGSGGGSTPNCPTCPECPECPEQPCTPNPPEFTTEHRFEDAVRVWSVDWAHIQERYETYIQSVPNACVPTTDFRRLVRDVTAWDDVWKQMMPHSIEADPAEESIIIRWSKPVSGTLTLTLVPTYTQ